MSTKIQLIFFVCSLFLSACATNQNKMSDKELKTLHKIIEISNRPKGLGPTTHLKCIELSDVTSKYTPPDLYNAAQGCFEAEEYDKGARLTALAGTRANYDTFRVQDKTSHKATGELIVSYFSNPQYSKDKKTINALLNYDPEICQVLKSVSPPSYIPEYMIARGKVSSLLKDKSQALIDGFEPELNWLKAIKKNKPCKDKVTSNVKVKGSLESKHKLGCITIREIKSIYTPADLYPSAAQCFIEEKGTQGFEVFMAASMYARYDMLRVTDKSARQAKNALILNTLYPLPEKKKAILAVQAKRIKTDSEFKNSLCNKMKALDIPDYHPEYMIKHGMKAVLQKLKSDAIKAGKPLPESMNIKESSGLVTNYKPEKLWTKSLKMTGLCTS